MRKAIGSALLSALFLMTLVAIAATAMSTRLQLDIYRNRMTIQSDKLYLASQVVAFWAMSSLTNSNIELKRLDETGRVLDFPKSLKRIYPDIVTQGSIYDLQAKFNLNNLVNKQFKPLFLRLLGNNLQKVDANAIKNILAATVSWVSPFRLDKGHDELMAYYKNQKPPYIAGNQFMQSVSEFRLVSGVTAGMYQILLPFVSALPTETPINVNTASATVLKILGSGLKDSQLNELLELRESKGQFESDDIPLLIGKFDILAKQISVESEYFMSVATVTSADMKLKHYTIIHIRKDENEIKTANILSETLNEI